MTHSPALGVLQLLRSQLSKLSQSGRHLQVVEISSYGNRTQGQTCDPGSLGLLRCQTAMFSIRNALGSRVWPWHPVRFFGGQMCLAERSAKKQQLLDFAQFEHVLWGACRNWQSQKGIEVATYTSVHSTCRRAAGAFRGTCNQKCGQTRSSKAATVSIPANRLIRISMYGNGL